MAGLPSLADFFAAVEKRTATVAKTAVREGLGMRLGLERFAVYQLVNGFAVFKLAAQMRLQ